MSTARLAQTIADLQPIFFAESLRDCFSREMNVVKVHFPLIRGWP
jgi:hypothetical protein